LRMTGLLAGMEVAVELPPASIAALEAAFEQGRQRHIGILWRNELAIVVRATPISPLVARHILPLLPTVAYRGDGYLASAAKARMTGPGAGVLPARQEITADLLTAIAFAILRLGAPFRRRILAAETSLRRAHESAWRTRTGMTG
jgi:hypothetical protein